MKKSYRLIAFLILLSFLLLISCTKPEFNNPFDWDEIPIPQNLNFNYVNINTINIFWNYDYAGIDGFVLARKVGNGSWNDNYLTFSSDTYSHTESGLQVGESYYYRIRAYYCNYNSDYSNEILVSFNCVDIDGNEYQIVQIGNQIWMAENLKVTHYNNGDPIPHLTDDDDWISTTSGAYCVYNNEPSNADIYGNLYNWYAVEDPRGLAPEGWHVPEDEEIMELEMYLGMTYEEAHDTGWRGTNEGSKLAGNADLWTDGALENDPEFGSSGFDFLPGGYRYHGNGNFGHLGYYGYFWSATEYDTYDTWRRGLNYDGTQVYRFLNYKLFGFSVRCVRD
ncbi:MAG: hypothetical protein JXB60_06395 [Candidatus Cloacimonetes bacterium]|nr:hypothetical protein [Candidatus Cloacimonadota bacterium]